MRSFKSSWFWQHPDLADYQSQKAVAIIKQSEAALPATLTGPPQPPMLGNNHLPHLWASYYGPRLAVAKGGWQQTFPAFFPGHTIPGSGAGQNTREIGCLAIQRWENLLKLQGGFPTIGPGIKIVRPKHNLKQLEQISDWPWLHVSQPQLHVLRPARCGYSTTPTEINQLKSWLGNRLSALILQGKVRETLSLIRRTWSSGTLDPLWAPETILAARQLINWVISDAGDFLATIFEIESVLAHVQYSWPLNISGYGIYQDCWLEVGRLPITDIKCAELAVTKRVLHELVNIRTKGFAAIVVNELGCDTDGTHRIISSWLWNLLTYLRETSPSLDLAAIQNSVGSFVAEHRPDMGEIVVREALRILAEILANPDLRRALEHQVWPHVGDFYPVTHLPVLLLPEYSCGAVIKGPYDEGVADYRVCPTIYSLLARDTTLVLPARGPYHLTDRAPLPWFQVLEKR